MKQTLYYACFLLVLSCALACKHTVDVKPAVPAAGNGNNNGGGNNSADTALCFERDILPIFVSNCAQSGCHDAASRQDGYVFTSYQTITVKNFVAGNAGATQLFEAITEDKPEKRMPLAPAAPLTVAQIALIERWINEGARNTTGCVAVCDTADITFATGVQPLLNTYCRGCHNASGASGGVMLDSHAGASAAAANGRLVGAVAHAAGYSPMPKNGAKLSDCQITKIRKWAAAGAPNN